MNFHINFQSLSLLKISNNFYYFNFKNILHKNEEKRRLLQLYINFAMCSPFNVDYSNYFAEILIRNSFSNTSTY